MRYIFGTGLIGVVFSLMGLARESKEQTLNWRLVLSWLSWGISLAFTVGAIVDIARARKGLPTGEDSPALNR